MLQSKNIKDSTEYKIQQGHKYVVLKIMQQNLKVLKKNAAKQEYEGQY